MSAAYLKLYHMDAEAAHDFTKCDPGGLRRLVNYKLAVIEGNDPDTIGEIMVRLSPTLWRSYNYLDTFPSVCWHDCWGIRGGSFWKWDDRECGDSRGTQAYVTDVLSFSDSRDAQSYDSPLGWLLDRIWEKKKLYRVCPSRPIADSVDQDSAA